MPELNTPHFLLLKCETEKLIFYEFQPVLKNDDYHLVRFHILGQWRLFWGKNGKKKKEQWEGKNSGKVAEG